MSPRFDTESPDLLPQFILSCTPENSHSSRARCAAQESLLSSFRGFLSAFPLWSVGGESSTSRQISRPETLSKIEVIVIAPRNSDQLRQAEIQARAALEERYGRALSDQEWAAAKAALLDFVKLLREWERNRHHADQAA